MKRLLDLTKAPITTIECRAMGHAWAWANDETIEFNRGKLAYVTRAEHCLRCGTERRRELNFHVGEISWTRLRYADDYLAAKGLHFTRRDALSEWYRRTAPKEKHTP